MKKILSCILVVCMILSLSVSSFATVADGSDIMSKGEISKLSDKFDITYAKDFYEKSGMAVYEDIQIVSDNIVTYKMNWTRIGVICFITEEILDDGRLKKTYVEGDLVNEVIYDKENGLKTVDGNVVDISDQIQTKHHFSEITPAAIPVWVYRKTPWPNTIASDYYRNVASGYKNVQYGSLIKTLGVAVIADIIALALGGPSLAASIAAAGIDWMATQAKAMSSPYSKTGKCYEVIYNIPGDFQTRYRHVVDYYDDYDGSYLFFRDFYSMYV